MKILKISLILIIGLAIFILPSCADYEDYTYTTSNDPAEAIEAMPKRLKLFSEGYFGIYSDLIPTSVLWDVDTKMDIWNSTALVSDIDSGTFEGFYSWRFEGIGAWIGIGVRVEPLDNLKDLSIYSNGHYNFAYKGTNGFKVGIKSMPFQEVWYNYTVLSNYGLRLDDTWCEISIPITNFASVNASFDLSNIEQYFMFSANNAAQGYNVGDVHFIDNVHLTKD